MPVQPMPSDSSTFDSFPQSGTYRWGVRDGSLHWSPALAKLYGREPVPNSEGGFLACVHPDDRVRVEAETLSFMERGETYSHIFRILRADGCVRTILDRGVIERADDGSPITFHGVNIDLTDDLVRSGLEMGADLGPGKLQPAARSRAVERAAGIGSYELNLETLQSYWSDELYRVVGGDPRRGASMELALENVHPDDRDFVRSTMEQAVQRLGTFDFEFRIVTPDGKVSWVRDRGESIGPQPDGKPQRVVGVLSDITRRKEMEVELRRTSGLLEAIFEYAPLGLAAFDRDFRFRRVNRKLAEINGIPAEEHIGKRPDELLPDLEDVDKVYDVWLDILTTKQPVLDHLVVGETKGTDQPRVWNEHFFPIMEGDDATGIAIIAEDVTERRRAEADQRASFDRLRKVLDGTIAFVGLLTPDGTMLEVNELALRAAGLSRDDVVGQKFWDAYWWSFDAPSVARLKEAVVKAAAGEPVRYDVDVRMVNDTRMTIDFLLSPIFDNDGRVEYLLPSGYDVTDRNRAIAQAQLLMQEVNHRSKNVLSLVQSIARQTAKADPKEFLTKFSDRLASLARVQDLLVKGNWNSFDLRLLVETQLHHFKDEIGTRIMLSGPEITVNANAAQNLSMALYELSTNASKYGSLSVPSGVVHIRWDVEHGVRGPLLSLDWRESGGPEVKPPQRRGFGSTLFERMIEVSCKAKTESRFDPAGFQWSLRGGQDCIVDFTS